MTQDRTKTQLHQRITTKDETISTDKQRVGTSHALGENMSNIIDIRARLKTKSEGKSSAKQAGNVVDISQIRSEVLEEERRKVRRTILTEFIAVHTLVPGIGLMKVSLFNINESGVAFDIDSPKGHFQVGEEVAMRVYLNSNTYFPFVAKIKHVTHIEDEGVHRHGCEFVNGTINDVALHHFIKFIETVSASLKQDKGDVIVTKINS